MANKKSHRRTRPQTDDFGFDLGFQHEAEKDRRYNARQNNRRRDSGKNRRRENKW